MTNRLFKLARQIIVLLIGLPVVVIGIILIPLPGPGILITVLGLFILSLEFDWAKKHFDKMRTKLIDIFDGAKRRAQLPPKSDDSDK